jgi:hypothetical protein
MTGLRWSFYPTVVQPVLIMASYNFLMLNWNVRGLNAPVRQRAVWDMVSVSPGDGMLPARNQNVVC